MICATRSNRPVDIIAKLKIQCFVNCPVKMKNCSSESLLRSVILMFSTVVIIKCTTHVLPERESSVMYEVNVPVLLAVNFPCFCINMIKIGDL